jgi:ubiquinone/menaquinone biosynthesis C-methylase UbiE
MDNTENKKPDRLLKQSPDRWWQQWDQPGIAKAIADYWQNDRTGFEPLHRQNLARLVSAYYQPSMASVLEVGCGNGLVYKELIPGVINNEQYTGVDVSDEMLKLAHKNFPAGNFLHGDIFGLQFLDSSFDLVLSFEVVIHLPEIETPIAEMLRVAGQMLIFTAWVSKEEKQTLIPTHINNVKFIHHYYEHKKVLEVIHQKAGKRQHYIEVRPLTDGTWAYVVFLDQGGRDQVIPFEGFLVQLLERYKNVGK